MATVSTTAGQNKPTKPYPDYPLFPHNNGQWAKKIRGKLHYFGVWDGSDEALEQYVNQRDDLQAGRTPRQRTDGLEIRDLLNRFLTAKQQLLENDEIVNRTFLDYHSTCERIAQVFGRRRIVDDLRSSDFEHLRAEIAKRWGPVALGNEIQRVRSIFKYAYDAALIDAPVRFGPTFKRPNRKVIRKARRANGPRMFEAEELQAMLDAAPLQLQAMILLGINCGFGNHDCGTLTVDALNLQSGWVDFPRPKTGVERRCPLWKETVEALRETLQVKRAPQQEEHGNLVFITKYGKPWAKDARESPISAECRKLLKHLGIYRKGVGFYALRHTFETIGGETRDQVAVDHIMGHVRDDMATVYRERISDERLKAVTDHVQAWLYPKLGSIKRTR